MQYKPEMEKVQMIDNSNVPTVYPIILNNNPQIKRTRQHLLIVLSICLILSLGATISRTAKSANDGPTARIGECFFYIIFYGFGILCAYRYSSLGLRIFAWIHVIGLIFVIIGIAIALFAILAGFLLINDTESDASTQNIMAVGSLILIIFIIGAIIGSILSIIIIILSFKLARLINAN